MDAQQLEIPGLEAGGTGAPAAQGCHPDVDWERLLINDNRCRLMEALYALAGRDNPEVDGHHTYTGLAEDLHAAVGRVVVDGLLRAPDFDPSLLIGAPEAGDASDAA